MTVAETPMERIEREMREHFPSETGRLDRAVDAFEAAAAALIRPDGSRRYSDAEHQERTTALLEKLDGTLATVTEAAEAAIGKAEADLAKARRAQAEPERDLLARIRARVLGTPAGAG